MSEVCFCPKCGGDILPEERYCGDCGYDSRIKTDDKEKLPAEPVQIDQPPAEPVEIEQPVSSETDHIDETINPLPIIEPETTYQMGSQEALDDLECEPLTSLYRPPIEPNRTSKKTVLILLLVLIIVFLSGTLYWWFMLD